MAITTKLKTIVAIALIVIAGTTMGCIEPEYEGSDGYTENEYRSTPQQYRAPEPVYISTPEPTPRRTVSTSISTYANGQNICVGNGETIRCGYGSNIECGHNCDIYCDRGCNIDCLYGCYIECGDGCNIDCGDSCNINCGRGCNIVHGERCTITHGGACNALLVYPD